MLQIIINQNLRMSNKESPEEYATSSQETNSYDSIYVESNPDTRYIK